MVNALVLAVAATGAFAVAQAVRAVQIERIDPLMLLILITLTAVSQRVQIRLFRSSAISVATAAIIASYVLFGIGIAVLLTLVETAVNAFTPTRKPLRKVVFNAGMLSTSAFTAATVYQLAGGATHPSDVAWTLVAVTLSAAAYFLMNSALTATVIALSERQNALTVWRTNYAWMPVNYLATAAQGAALAMASQALGVFGVAIFTLPLAVAWY
ncbi:MAG TPA: hypothetical protein VI814_15170, partial [Candidatus Limnocylindria bacterium]